MILGFVFPNLAVTGILLSVVGTAVYALKELPNKAIAKLKTMFVYSVNVYQYDDLYEAIEEWLTENCNHKYRDVEGFSGASNNNYPVLTSSVGVQEKRTVRFRHDGAEFMVKYGGKNIYISNGKEKMENSSNITDLYFRKFIIMGYNSKNEINDLVSAAFEKFLAKRQTNKTNIYINNGYGSWEKANELKVKPITEVFLPSETKDKLINELEQFLTDEKWYEARGIPYKRGYLFHGPPGNGKTTLSLALAAHTGKSIFVLSLKSLSGDESLRRCFSELPTGSIMLIEDIDAAFNGRISLVEKITFSGLLNCMDGALYKHGTVLVITTNHIENLDPALIRSGRCDFKLKVDNPTTGLINSYLLNFYGHCLGEINDYKQDISMSEVQEICIANKSSMDNCLKELSEPN